MKKSFNKTKFIIAFLFASLLIPIAFASWRLPSGKTLVVPAETKWHFSDVWLNPKGKDMKVTTFFENNWLNYSVGQNSTQLIYMGKKPAFVYINGESKTEGDGWTYADGVITVTIP